MTSPSVPTSSRGAPTYNFTYRTALVWIPVTTVVIVVAWWLVFASYFYLRQRKHTLRVTLFGIPCFVTIDGRRVLDGVRTIDGFTWSEIENATRAKRETARRCPCPAPPCGTLDGVARFFWSDKTYRSVFRPARADIVYDWSIARMEGARWRARWIRLVRGPVTMLSNMSLQLPFSVGGALRIVATLISKLRA